MNRTQLEMYFSGDRLTPYFNHYPGNAAKAIYFYEANITLSEALYTPLSILEVALRNKINAELERKYRRPDWYADWYLHPMMRYAWPEINNAIRQLHDASKPLTPGSVTASLMFGFWTSLFNDRYERELWSNLRFIFPNMPRAIRQRRNISSPLNDIRQSLRNRIYHNEPVIFNMRALQNHYQHITDILGWMGTDLLAYNNTRDRFPVMISQVVTRLNSL